MSHALFSTLAVNPVTVEWVAAIATGTLFLSLPKYTVILYLKGKAVPLQAWSGPKGSRKLRFPDFLTTAQDGGKVVSLTHRPHLPPRNTPGTHFC
jgi:hypothetical protein